MSSTAPAPTRSSSKNYAFARAAHRVVDILLYGCLIVLTVILVFMSADPHRTVMMLVFVFAAGVLLRVLDVPLDAYFWNAFLFWFVWLTQSVVYYLLDEVTLARTNAASVEEERETVFIENSVLHAVTTLLQFLVAMLFTVKSDWFVRPVISRFFTVIVLVLALLPYRDSNAFHSLWMSTLRVTTFVVLFASVYYQFQSYVETLMRRQLLVREQRLLQQQQHGGGPDTLSRLYGHGNIMMCSDMGRVSIRSFKMARAMLVVLCLGYVLYGQFHTMVFLGTTHLVLIAFGALGQHIGFSLERRGPSGSNEAPR